jgi:hypothetical protein
MSITHFWYYTFKLDPEPLNTLIDIVSKKKCFFNVKNGQIQGSICSKLVLGFLVLKPLFKVFKVALRFKWRKMGYNLVEKVLKICLWNCWKNKKNKNHFHFDSFFIACAQTIVMRHQQFSLITSMLVSYYWQCMSIALQCSQAITIFQQALALGRVSGLISIASAPSSLANLWQMTIFSS